MIGNVASNTLTRDQAAKSFSGMIARFMPMGDAPLFGLTSMLKTETALQFQHGYFSKSMIFPSVTLSVQAAIGDTVLSVTSLLILFRECFYARMVLARKLCWFKQ
jgi:hypothetical protein